MRHRRVNGSLSPGGEDLQVAGNKWVCVVALAWLSATGARSDAVEVGQAPDSQQRMPLPAPGGEAWRPIVFPTVRRQTSYFREILEGSETLRSESNCAASGFVLPLSTVELSDTPLLSWRWRVDVPLDIPDERSKQGDDFAARVYVLFRFDSSRASAFDWLRHRVGRIRYGDQTPGKTLNFVWTSREKPGAFWDNPFAPDAKMIALAQGATTTWRTETVDLIEHYRRHFGSPVGELMGLAVMTDSDNSCQTALARFADFSFSARAAELPAQAPNGRNDD